MPQELLPVRITGMGMCVPDRVLTNHDLEKLVDTSDEWILTRTGIRERRICAPEEANSDLSTKAARRAIEDAGLTPNDIEAIICCTFTPDYSCPATACIVQERLGISNMCPAFDLAAACSGFIYGCSVGANFIRTGMYRNVLVIGSEAISKVIDFEDRNTCVLFGDGAGAAVLSVGEPGFGLLGQVLGADGTGNDLIIVPSSGSREPTTPASLDARRQYLQMNGNEVFKFATRVCGRAIQEALAQSGDGLSAADLKVIVPHQANIRILETASKRLGLPMERFIINIERYGNTSAATVPLALAEAKAEGRIEPGDLIAMVAFGGGLTYAASIWRW